MSYKLEKPDTGKERTDFIYKYNHDCFGEGYHCRIEETETALFALEPNEIIVDGVAVINSNYEKEQQEQEQARINNLTMTALDFLKVLYSIGLTREQVHNYLSEHPDLDEQLKYCQNVYCGVVKQLCPIVIGEYTITSEMVEQGFKVKNRENKILITE